MSASPSTPISLEPYEINRARTWLKGFVPQQDDALIDALCDLAEKGFAQSETAASTDDRADDFRKAWDEAIEAAAAVANREWVGENSLTGSKVAKKIADGIRDLRSVEASDV